MTSRLEPAAIYKRMVISLRSLFSYIRVLPAYRLFRACAVRPPPQAFARPPYAHHLDLVATTRLLPNAVVGVLSGCAVHTP